MAQGNAIGIIELCSLYKGYEVQDQVLKSEFVEKLLARSICSGKYLILVRGRVADVESALDNAREIGDFAIVSTLVIPNVDERIFSAIVGSTLLEDNKDVSGLAVVETYSVAAAIKAADYALKEAEVNILRIHVAMAIGGKGLLVLTGDIEPLRSALNPVLEFIENEGTLAGHTLITNPHEDVLKDLV